MKKLLLAILLTGACTLTFAQSAKKITFGVKGGLNFATVSYSNVTGGTLSANSLTSFNAGVFADFRLCEAFSIQPALMYTGKGAKETGALSNSVVVVTYTSTSKVQYLQLPVYGLYHAPVGNHDFHIGAGPFVAYGLSGNDKGSSTMTVDGENPETTEIDRDTKFGNDETSTCRRWDYGVSAMAGFKFSSGFLVSVNYDLGLANAAPDVVETNPQIKTRVLGVSIGYAF